MQLRLLNKLRDLTPKQRGVFNRFLEDGDFRAKLQAAIKAKGLGDAGKLDPQNIAAWFELILKYLPQIIALIAML